MKLILERWNKFLNESNLRTLVHGTTIDNLESIKKYGLDAELAYEEGKTSFVDQFYDDLEEEFERFIFLADKQGMETALTAMRAQIASKLDKFLSDVTEEDIKTHGLLVIIRDVDIEEDVKYALPKDYDQPYTVEPGDYYVSSIGGDEFVFGNALMRYLRRYKLIPIETSFGMSSPKYAKQKLIQFAIKYHSDVEKEKIVKKVKSLSDEEAKRYLKWYENK